MPKNCSVDVEAVIAHFDKVFTGTNQTEIDDLKALYGMSAVTHLDDAAGAREYLASEPPNIKYSDLLPTFPLLLVSLLPSQYSIQIEVRNPIWDWQSLQPTSGPGAAFFKFCDALEVKDGQNAPESGWGLDHALPAWGTFFKDQYIPRCEFCIIVFPLMTSNSILPVCGDIDTETCLGTYDENSTFYTDTSVDNSWRSWNWIVCNEVGYLQEGPPENVPAIVSRLVQPEYDERQCQWMFPEAFDKPPEINVDKTNEAYGGWQVNVNRLFFANGQRKYLLFVALFHFHFWTVSLTRILFFR